MSCGKNLEFREKRTSLTVCLFLKCSMVRCSGGITPDTHARICKKDKPLNESKRVEDELKDVCGHQHQLAFPLCIALPCSITWIYANGTIAILGKGVQKQAVFLIIVNIRCLHNVFEMYRSICICQFRFNCARITACLQHTLYMFFGEYLKCRWLNIHFFRSRRER